MSNQAGFRAKVALAVALSLVPFGAAHAAGETAETVVASVNYTLPANVEALYMIGAGLTGTGSGGSGQVTYDNTTPVPTATIDAVELWPVANATAAAAGAKLILLQELHNGAYFCQHEAVAEFGRRA
mgnify:CR=1 FL=1